MLYIVHWLDDKVSNYHWCTVQTWRLGFECFSKICRENSCWIKIGQE